MGRKKKEVTDELSEREKDIIKFIEKQISKYGYAPSVREICNAVELKSTATVHGYLGKLAEKGYIKKENQKGRAIRLVKGVNGKKLDKTSAGTYLGTQIEEVPVIGKITTGTPILAEENITETFPISADFVGNTESFILTAKGESMKDAGIFDGDYILVKKQDTADNGETIVALLEDEPTVTTYYKEDGHIRLQPENSGLEPIIVPDCQILGKVSGVFRKM